MPSAEGIFRECRWRWFADVTAEGYFVWREESGRGALHDNRVLRAAKAFFDAMVIAGALPATPLRAVEPLAQPVTTNASGAA